MDEVSIGTVATIVIGVVLAIVVLIAIARTVRIVSQATAGIVERLGRYHRTLDPGLHFLFPFVDRCGRPSTCASRSWRSRTRSAP